MRATLLPLLLLATATGARAQFYVQSSLIDDHKAVAGETVDGVVPLVNETDAPVRVRLYLTDYRYRADGTTEYPDPGTDPSSAAPWVSVGSPEVTVPPRSRTDVGYRVRVPASATSAETRWCLLMIEAVGDGPDPAGTARQRVGLDRRVRFGVQIAVTLGDPLADVELLDAGLATEPGGGPVLWTDVGNAGAGATETRVSLDLFDAEGRPHGRIEGSDARLYPGTSFRHRVSLGGVPEGTYQGLLVVDTGRGESVGTQLTIVL